jgi:quercetin 2,3-dioxygenase
MPSDSTTLMMLGNLPPRDRADQSSLDSEVITYVRTGMVTYEDCLGDRGLIGAGEFARATARQGTSYSITNASTKDWARVYQIWLRSSADAKDAHHEQKRFSTADRRGTLRVVVSRDGREGSLRIQQDSLLFSAELPKGTHVVHALGSGRCVWLHLVEGSLKVGELLLKAGDSIEVVDELSVSVTATAESELLLLDSAIPVANGV